MVSERQALGYMPSYITFYNVGPRGSVHPRVHLLTHYLQADGTLWILDDVTKGFRGLTVFRQPG